MWEVIAGVVALVGLILGYYLRRNPKTKRQKVLDEVTKELNKRNKASGRHRDWIDFDRGNRVDLLLRKKGSKNTSK